MNSWWWGVVVVECPTLDQNVVSSIPGRCYK